jgi:pimeloyl-ACP methyl ester carboxylesterase
MRTVTSKDGTPIAYETAGTGHPVVFTTGAFNDHTTCAELAGLLADAYTVVTYDRRGRGESGDTPPFAIPREIEDLAALLEEIGPASVFGYSSGGMIALQAAAEGLPITGLVLYEPPFAAGVPSDLPERMQAAVDDGRPGDAVSLFQAEAVKMPPPLVAQIRESPMFAGLAAIAQSAVYDTIITVEFAEPTPSMRALETPTLVLHGTSTWPVLVSAAALIAAAVPGAVLRAVDGGEGHGIPPEPTAAAMRAFL